MQSAPAEAATPSPEEEVTPPEVDPGIIEGRRIPGYNPDLPDPVSQDNPGAVRAPPPEAFPTDQFPIPDRWRLIETLGVVKQRWWDPYHQNTYKGDRPINRAKVPWLPINGDDWFINASLTSDTLLEPRTFPIPVGVQTTARPQSLDVFGKNASYAFSQTFLASAALIKGSTAFKPPEIEYRLTLALNINHVRVPEKRVLFVEPSKGTKRTDNFLGVQEATSITICVMSRSAMTSIQSASGSSRSRTTSAAFCSTTINSAFACSVIATTTACNTIWRRSGGWKRTPTAASTI